MTTKEFNVERNYRIDNLDQYAKARFNQTVIPDEGETTEDAALRAIKQLDNIFRMAYPYVEESLNFNVVRQVNGNNNYITKTLHTFTVPPEPLNHSDKEIEAMNNPETATDGTPYIPKIGTTERTIYDIQQCKTVTQLKDDYAFMASMNKKLKVAYDEKMTSFTIGNKSEPTY